MEYTRAIEFINNHRISMTKLFVISLLSLSLAGCQYLGISQSITPPNQDANPVTSQDDNSLTGSLRQLVMGNNSVRCQYQTEIDGQPSQGTVYVTEGKVRGEFVSGSSNSFMISDGAYSYIWGDEYETGLKMPVLETDSTATPEPLPSDMPRGFDMDQEVEYQCNAWNPDQSFFVPPIDIEFVDYSQLIKALPTSLTAPAAGAESDEGSACAACDALSGDMKTQCLAALSCN